MFFKENYPKVAEYCWSEIVDVCANTTDVKGKKLYFANNRDKAIGLYAHRHLKRKQYSAT